MRKKENNDSAFCHMYKAPEYPCFWLMKVALMDKKTHGQISFGPKLQKSYKPYKAGTADGRWDSHLPCQCWSGSSVRLVWAVLWHWRGRHDMKKQGKQWVGADWQIHFQVSHHQCPLFAAVVFRFPDVDHWSPGPVVNKSAQSYIINTDGKGVLWG